MSAKNYFLITIPHLVDSSEARKANAAAHHQGALIQSGVIRAAGAQLSPDGVSTDANAMEHIRGSWAIVQTDNTEQIWELLKEDPFWKNSVWDTEKVSIVPVLIGRGNIQ